MNSPRDISDRQVYALMRNANAFPWLKETISIEFASRNFTPEYLLTLQAQHEIISPDSDATLSAGEKAIIIISSPTLLCCFIGVPIHAWFANKYISKGQLKKWRQYWRCLMMGFVAWTVGLILVAKLFFKN